jgi:hypothetical protein
VVGFPLLIIPFAIYNMIAFITPMEWSTQLLSAPVPLKSGSGWTPTLGEAFLIFSLLMLLLEFAKSAKHGKSFVEHFIALLLAGGAAAEFAMVTQAATPTFLLFTVICFVDLFAGFSASLRRARRKVVVEHAPVVVTPPPAAAPVRVEPARVEPARVEPARVETARVEPAAQTASPFGAPSPRAEAPVVKADPVQKIEP